MRALLLDLDDTLLDYSGGADACWEHACAVAADVVAPAVLVPALAETRRWFWGDVERHRRERVDMLGAWTRIAAHALERCGCRVDGLAAAIASDFAARRRAVMRLFPDALECLEALRRRGVPLALVTNGDAREQRDKIARHGLAPYFGAIVIEGELGVGKPEPVVFLEALSRLGVGEPGPDVWMVGDHLEFDVAGSQRLGLRAAWVDREGLGLPAGTTVRPDRILRALVQLHDREEAGR